MIHVPPASLGLALALIAVSYIVAEAGRAWERNMAAWLFIVGIAYLFFGP